MWCVWGDVWGHAAKEGKETAQQWAVNYRGWKRRVAKKSSEDWS